LFTSLSARETAREGEKRKSIKLIHADHAKAAQGIEQHIAPGYEAGENRAKLKKTKFVHQESLKKNIRAETFQQGKV
jgi:hypothetical protein